MFASKAAADSLGLPDSLGSPTSNGDLGSPIEGGSSSTGPDEKSNVWSINNRTTFGRMTPEKKLEALVPTPCSVVSHIRPFMMISMCVIVIVNYVPH
jgi:hypothetical protein